jgi:hypothetical protein
MRHERFFIRPAQILLGCLCRTLHARGKNVLHNAGSEKRYLFFSLTRTGTDDTSLNPTKQPQKRAPSHPGCRTHSSGNSPHRASGESGTSLGRGGDG